MKSHILALSILFAAANSLCAQTRDDYYYFIKSSEGYRLTPYKDSLGYLTVGIGHRIVKGENVKAKYTDADVKYLFDKDLDIALRDAKYLFPSFNSHPRDIKLVLVSLSYNLGRTKLAKFINFRANIEKRNYSLAANDLQNSLWYRQIGNRGKKYFNIVKNAK